MATPDDATWDEAAFEVALRRVQAEAWVDEGTYVAQLRELIEEGRAGARSGESITTEQLIERLTHGRQDLCA